MPTERFYRLPEEKKKAIRDAAIKEFIRVPYEKASINKMIQSADISRGSFYTYFEDKGDVLSFILQDARKKGKELAVEILEENHGDIWNLLQEMLDHGLQYCENHDVYQLFRNISSYPEVEKIIRAQCEAEDGMGVWVKDYVDTSRFRNPSEQGVNDIMVLGFAILGEAVGSLYKNGAGLDEVKEAFGRRLELLRLGACVNE